MRARSEWELMIITAKGLPPHSARLQGLLQQTQGALGLKRLKPPWAGMLWREARARASVRARRGK